MQIAQQFIHNYVVVTWICAVSEQVHRFPDADVYAANVDYRAGHAHACNDSTAATFGNHTASFQTSWQSACVACVDNGKLHIRIDFCPSVADRFTLCYKPRCNDLRRYDFGRIQTIRAIAVQTKTDANHIVIKSIAKKRS